MSIESSLRKLSSKEATLEEMEEFQRQVDHETNDRGACILMATNVELALNHAVFHVLEWDEDTFGQLTSEEGPAGTFSQNIHLGHFAFTASRPSTISTTSGSSAMRLPTHMHQ